MYKHILVAIDYSVNSQAICQKAKQICTLNGAKISILHVIHEYPKHLDDQYNFIPLSIGTDDDLIAAHRRSLGAFADEIGVDENNRWLGIGDPAQQIAEFVERKRVDLVFIGTHGHGGLKNFIGSTATSVLQDCGCDVISVYFD